MGVSGYAGDKFNISLIDSSKENITVWDLENKGGDHFVKILCQNVMLLLQ